jgi:hypothetical protein
MKLRVSKIQHSLFLVGNSILNKKGEIMNNEQGMSNKKVKDERNKNKIPY